MLADQHMVVNAIIPNLRGLFHMVKSQTFRILPRDLRSKQDPDFDTEDQILDPMWPELQPVYELFYGVILSKEISQDSLKRFVTHGFIQEVGDY